MMTFTELLKNRRSIRDFQDKEVPLKIVEEILQEATLAPSASNNQPCRFSVVNCKNTIKDLSDESKANLLDDFAKKKTSLDPGYVDVLKDKIINNGRIYCYDDIYRVVKKKKIYKGFSG